MKKMNLVVIDPQYDFVDKEGSLYVDGAENDMENLCLFVGDRMNSLSEVVVTLDAHPYVHIAHPAFWRNEKGINPKCGQKITACDLASGKWRIVNPLERDLLRIMKHFEIMPELTIWPVHCIVGTQGFNIHGTFSNMLRKWMDRTGRNVRYTLKGMDAESEQFSAVEPVVPKISVKDTKFVADAMAGNPDIVLVAGEALSHCIKNTVEDWMSVLERDRVEEKIERIVLLTDCMSNVKGYEAEGKKFLKNASKRGIQAIESSKIDTIL